MKRHHGHFVQPPFPESLQTLANNSPPPRPSTAGSNPNQPTVANLSFITKRGVRIENTGSILKPDSFLCIPFTPQILNKQKLRSAKNRRERPKSEPVFEGVLVTTSVIQLCFLESSAADGNFIQEENKTVKKYEKLEVCLT